MQTFIPYPNFQQSASTLDRMRLGKQRVETLQILNCLLVKPSRWNNHPAVKMWRGYEFWLVTYGLEICKEWHIVRGYKDTCFDKILGLWDLAVQNGIKKPHWLGDERFHSSHRASLLAKNLEWYSQFSWSEEPKIDYFWPV